jgi:anti-anti-sigma factor
MEIIQRTIDSFPILDIIGEVDLYNAREIKDTLDAIMKLQKYEVVINLAEVPFMDSSGIGCLVTGMYKLKKYYGRLLVTGVTGSVAKVFKLTGMESHLEVLPTVEDAITSLKNTQGK